MAKVFGTDGIRAVVGSPLMNPQFITKLGWAVGRVLAKAGDSKVLIGKDTRISGYMLESAMEAGLTAAGVEVLLLGPMPTPAIAHLTRSLRAQIGVVISASHNLYEDNGIKFFSAQGVKLSDEIERQIENMIDQPLEVVSSRHIGKAWRVNDAAARYIEFCKSRVADNLDFSQLKIVIDCANGATYKIAPSVFKELGAEVIELGVNPDGCNINDNCGSTRPEILSTIVKAEKADLGIALDGDGDRLILVDHTGDVVDGDEALYIIVKNYLDTKSMQGGVVGTLMSNMGLEVALRDQGIDFIRTNVGDRYVSAELQRLGWLFGGESSGHIICRDTTTTGDGIISALKVVSAMLNTGRTLRDLRQGMQKFPQTMINVRLTDPTAAVNSPQIINAVRDVESQLNGHGRVLLRASGTEPLVRVMVEGDDLNMVNVLATQLAELVRATYPAM
ncbi:MAG: phosphoglucosamine mutase [Legionellales bacterium]|nr:phosphoglucosamine mutase [Legionellales bacterium]